MCSEKSIADSAVDGLREHNPEFGLLYKYQSIGDYSLDALANGYVYFSDFNQLNDPFDPFITLVGAMADNHTIEMLVSKGPKVCCFTSNCNSPLMWAHYALARSGMCIGYAVFLGNPRIVNPVRYVERIPQQVTIGELFWLKHEIWSYEEEWRTTLATKEHKHERMFHPVCVYLGPNCSAHNIAKVNEALPTTVNAFQVKFPAIYEDGVF